MKTILFAAAIAALALAPAAFAEDAMGHACTNGQDAMGHACKADAMHHDTMGHGTMGHDSMSHDTMGHDTTKTD